MDGMKISGSHQMHIPAVTQRPAENPLKPAETKPQSAPKDTVQISSAAQSAFQKATQEATETSAQTAQEARSGDAQAQRLLAREQAEQPSSKVSLEETGK